MNLLSLLTDTPTLLFDYATAMYSDDTAMTVELSYTTVYPILLRYKYSISTVCSRLMYLYAIPLQATCITDAVTAIGSVVTAIGSVVTAIGSVVTVVTALNNISYCYYCYPTISVPIVMFKPTLIFIIYSHLFIPLLNP